MRIYLQQPAGKNVPPKFCHLHLQQDLLSGWNLIRESGSQGAAGRLTRKHFEDHEAALEALGKAKELMVNKGFKIVFADGVHINHSL